MIRYLTILLLLSLIGCQKQELRPIQTNTVQLSPDGTTLSLLKDTTLNSDWNGNGQVYDPNNFVIHGKGKFYNWKIHASMWQKIFDTTIVLENIKTYDAESPFSCMWLGANVLNEDNWWYIQKSINTCINNNIKYCYLPEAGIYLSSKNIEIQSQNSNPFCTLFFYGGTSFWDSGNGSTIRYTTATTGAAINLQLNKGSKVHGIALIGLWKSPNTPDSIFYNTKVEDFKDVSGKNCNDKYFGLAIDNDLPTNGSIGGSTGCEFYNMSISNFSSLVAISQNGITRNCEIMRFTDIKGGEAKHFFITSQAQEKDMVIDGFYCWSNIFSIVEVGYHGVFQAGDYKFSNGNIAGRTIMFCRINAAGWYSTHFDHVFCERTASIGIISTGVPITFDNSTFHLAFIKDAGRQIVLTSNSNFVQFNNSIIRYYDGTKTDLWMKGTAVFNNCLLGGNIIWK